MNYRQHLFIPNKGPVDDLTWSARLPGGPTYSSGRLVPYANGETPLPGDYVKNEFEQPGTVTRIGIAFNGDELVSIRRHDGGFDSLLTPATKFTLISRHA